MRNNQFTVQMEIGDDIINLLSSVRTSVNSLTNSISTDNSANTLVEITKKCERLDVLRKVGQQVLNIYDHIQQVIDKQQDSIDNDIKQFENFISHAKRAISGVPNDVKKTTTISSEKSSDDLDIISTPEERETVDSKFSSKRTWVEVASGKSEKNNSMSALIKVAPKKQEIAPGVYLNAYTINHPRECHQYKGFLCWSVVYSRFYISVNNEIIESITAPIYPSSKRPFKCLEHRDCEKFGKYKDDYRKTDYYIPRRCNAESKDVRHFTNRMSYVGASEPLKKNDVYVYRLGSRPNLYNDLNHLTEKDYYMFADLTGNYFLSLIAAAKEMRRRKENR